ncbi:MAG: hypothetical protein RLY61_209 [Candidatus Parcubacteria bacterium]|jgi:hypothetical protein
MVIKIKGIPANKVSTSAVERVLSRISITSPASEFGQIG